jgi:histidinol-phosphatase (PHP family)
VKYSCLHTHTVFCDGKNTVEEMCAAAFKKNFVSLGFSAHAPITRKTGVKTVWHLPDEKLPTYIDEVLAAKKRWRGKLQVYLGLEIDYIDGVCGPADKDWDELPLDFRIGSVHYPAPPPGLPKTVFVENNFSVDMPGEGFTRGFENYYGGDGQALFNSYYDALNSMIRAGGFDVVGHLDLVKRNNRFMPGDILPKGKNADDFIIFNPDNPLYQKRAIETADIIAAENKKSAQTGPVVVEANTGGMIRKRIAEPYPSEYIMKLLCERVIPMTINADAHSTEHLGGYYEEAAEYMRRAGYQNQFIYEDNQWKSVTLKK